MPNQQHTVKIFGLKWLNQAFDLILALILEFEAKWPTIPAGPAARGLSEKSGLCLFPLPRPGGKTGWHFH